MSTRISVFSTPTCQPCKVLKRRFEAEGVPFEAVDLTERPDELARLKGPGGRVIHTPCVEVDGEVVMMGFNPTTMKQIIADHGAAK